MFEKILYRSESVARMMPGELASLLTAARNRNRAANVTGLLLYREGVFLQVFEGEPASVADTWARIRRDCRHHRIEMMERIPVRQREFRDWRMGFFEVEDEALARLGALQADRRQPLLSLARIRDASLARALLASYR